MFERLGNQIAGILIQAVRTEFRLQGHNLTGRLSKSIRDIVTLTTTGANIKILAESYGVILNRGVPASRIPYTPGKRSGAKTSQYILGLQNFVKKIKVGLSSKEILSFAFAIAKKHAKGGMPTAASRRFSKTGRRTRAIDIAFNKVEKEIKDMVEDFTKVIIVESFNLAA